MAKSKKSRAAKSVPQKRDTDDNHAAPLRGPEEKEAMPDTGSPIAVPLSPEKAAEVAKLREEYDEIARKLNAKQRAAIL
jgi:hypothetical protein